MTDSAKTEPASDSKAPVAVRPFFIAATRYGTGYQKKCHVHSSNVVSLETGSSSAGTLNPAVTHLILNADAQAGEAGYAVVNAPLSRVKEIFAQRGYDFVSEEDLAAPEQPAGLMARLDLARPAL